MCWVKGGREFWEGPNCASYNLGEDDYSKVDGFCRASTADACFASRAASPSSWSPLKTKQQDTSGKPDRGWSMERPRKNSCLARCEANTVSYAATKVPSRIGCFNVEAGGRCDMRWMTKFGSTREWLSFPWRITDKQRECGGSHQYWPSAKSKAWSRVLGKYRASIAEEQRFAAGGRSKQQAAAGSTRQPQALGEGSKQQQHRAPPAHINMDVLCKSGTMKAGSVCSRQPRAPCTQQHARSVQERYCEGDICMHYVHHASGSPGGALQRAFCAR